MEKLKPGILFFYNLSIIGGFVIDMVPQVGQPWFKQFIDVEGFR